MFNYCGIYISVIELFMIYFFTIYSIDIGIQINIIQVSIEIFLTFKKFTFLHYINTGEESSKP